MEKLCEQNAAVFSGEGGGGVKTFFYLCVCFSMFILSGSVGGCFGHVRTPPFISQVYVRSTWLKLTSRDLYNLI